MTSTGVSATGKIDIHTKNAGIAREKVMRRIEVESIKVAHNGDRAERSRGGSRYPYFLFSGVVTLEFKEKRDVRVWTPDSRKTIEGFVVFNLKMDGVASIPSGLSEPFSYAAEAGGDGYTLRQAGLMTCIDRLYVPVGEDYPYPTVYGWGKKPQKCQIQKIDGKYKLYQQTLEDDIHNWLLPGWGTNWTRERGGYQYKLAAR